MKKAFLLNLIVALVITNALILSSVIAQGASTDQDKAVAQAIKDAQGKVVITRVSDFNGVVVVKTGDQTVELVSGEAVETLNGVMEKKPISWKDVAAYEKVIVNQEAPNPKKLQFTRWVLENVHTRRINRVLDELKARLKKQYQETHNGEIPAEDRLSAYLPGKTVDEREKYLAKIVNQVAVEQLGLDPTGGFTNEGWDTKVNTPMDKLRDVDPRKLYENAGLTQPPTDVTHTDLIKDPGLTDPVPPTASS